MNQSVSLIVQSALDGDVSAISRLEALSHELTQTDGESPLLLTASAVSRVLRALYQGDVDPVDVQKWATFVRTGYVAGNSVRVRPLRIDYETEFEDPIVEAIARMGEIGDSVDGVVERTEIQELLNNLN
jgi:hypothetical protein